MSRADLARRAALAPSTVSAVVSDLQAAGLVVEPAEPVHPPERGTRRPPAGADRAAPPGRRGRRDRLRQAPPAAGDLRSLATRCWPSATARSTPICLQRRRSRWPRRCSPTRSRRPRSPATRSSASAWACPARCTARRASSATRRSFPAGSGSRAADAVADGARPPRRGRERRQPRRARRVDVGRGPRRRPHGLREGRDRHRRRASSSPATPYVGAGGTAGELGHTVVDPGGPICRCGNRGCLETYAGAPAILGSLRDVHGDDLTLPEAVAFARPRRRRLPARDRRRRHRDRHRRGDALQPLQPAPGGGRRRSRRRRRAAARRRCGNRWCAARSAPRRRTSTVVQGELGERAEVLGAVALVLGRGAEASTS